PLLAQSGHAFVHCICLLLTQSGHQRSRRNGSSTFSGSYIHCSKIDTNGFFEPLSVCRQRLRQRQHRRAISNFRISWVASAKLAATPSLAYNPCWSQLIEHAIKGKTGWRMKKQKILIRKA